jgi:hypothetical protein
MGVLILGNWNATSLRVQLMGQFAQTIEKTLLTLFFLIILA